MPNPTLEFYRFRLTPRKGAFKTFKDFAKEELNRNKEISNEKAIELTFKHFIKSLEGEHAKDDKLKKQITLIRKAAVNKHLTKQPSFNSGNQTISGVINGGPFGRDGILSDIVNLEDASVLSRTKSVLQYFYFFLYIPMDHNEGCYIIHSNGSDESITRVFRNFLSNIFKGNSYNKANYDIYCPKSFQEEYKSGAILNSITFKKSYIDNIHSTDSVLQQLQQYDIKIEAIPKNKNFLFGDLEKIKDFFSTKLFGDKNKAKSLAEFDETKIITENATTHSKKVFEWNTKDRDFVPTIYLDKRITKKNADGTPDFDELHTFCTNYFTDEILPEIRPDLYVTKHK